MKWLLVIASLLPIVALGQGANTVVGADLDTARIRIGEQVDLRIHVTYTAGAEPSIQWPAIGDTLSAHVEVVLDPGVDTASNGSDRLVQERTLTITSFDTGFWAIPPFRFLVNARTGEVQGERPWSWVKITFAVLAAILVITVLVLLFKDK